MNAFGQVLLAGLNIVTFPTPKAPRFEFGWYWVMANNFVQVILVFIIMLLHGRQKRLATPILYGETVEKQKETTIVGRTGDDGTYKALS
jgi:ACS family pantothenate transporter-like MFS transporter